jgi:hypothetical protein
VQSLLPLHICSEVRNWCGCVTQRLGRRHYDKAEASRVKVHGTEVFRHGMCITFLNLSSTVDMCLACVNKR